MPIKIENQQTGYDKLYNNAVKYKMFNASQWQNALLKGNTDAYTAMLAANENLDVDKFNIDYGNKFADADRLLTAQYNEAFGDREKKKWYDITNLDGTTTRQYLSEYDYVKQALKQRNEIDKLAYDAEITQKIKDQRNGFAKALATMAVPVTELGQGIIDALTDTGIFFAGLGKATFTDGNWFDILTSTMHEMREGSFAEYNREALDEWERNWSYAKDVNTGEWSDAVASTIGGVMYSFGQMVPSMLASNGVSAAMSAAGASTSATSTVAGAVGRTGFYTAITSDRINEAYNLAEGTSISSAQIVLNGVMKAAVEIAVEEGLGKLLKNRTALDEVAFGTAQSVGKGKTLTTAGALRILKDAGQEGLEEVLQDTATWMLDQGFAIATGDDYWLKLSEGQVSPEALFQSFISGALMSLGGSAAKLVEVSVKGKVNDAIIASINKQLENPDLTAEQRTKLENKLETARLGVSPKKIVVGKDGELKEVRLNPIAAYEYGVDMESFLRNTSYVMNTYEELTKLAQTLPSDADAVLDKNAQNRLKAINSAIEANDVALKEVYTAYRMLSSVYSNMNADQIAETNKILLKMSTEIFSNQTEKSFTDASVRKIVETRVADRTELAQTFRKTLSALHGDTKVKVSEYLAKHGVEEDTAAVINDETDLSEADISDETKKIIDKILKTDKMDIVATADDIPATVVENTLVVSKSDLENATPSEIYNEAAESVLSTRIAEGKFFKAEFDSVAAILRKTTAYAKLDDEAIARALLVDKNAFDLVLYDPTTNREMYHFMRSLYDVVNAESKNAFEAALGVKAETVLTQMQSSLYNYAINQPEVNVEEIVELFPSAKRDTIRKKIFANRWVWDIREKYMRGDKLTDTEMNVLVARVNSLPIKGQTKSSLINGLKSDVPTKRRNTMHMLEAYSTGVWTNAFDGKTYPVLNSTGNNILYHFLKNINCTLKTWMNEDKLSESDRSVMQTKKFETVGELREFQFNQFAPDYQFKIDNESVYVYGSDGLTIDGFSNYVKGLRGINDAERSATMLKGKDGKDVKKLLSDSVTSEIAEYVTINDVIMNPQLLNDDIKSAIESKYGKLTQGTARAYLATEYFPKLHKGKVLTVVEFQDGSYGIGDATKMMSLFNSSIPELKPNTEYKLSTIMEKKYLVGPLKNTVVRFTNAVDSNSDGNFGAYDNESHIKNVITVSNDLLKENSDYLKYVIAHEWQHAYQTFNYMNNGSGAEIITTKYPQWKELVAQFDKYAPNVLKNANGVRLKNKAAIAKAINHFLYYGTGEYQAHGTSGEYGLEFTPVISSYEFVDVLGKKEFQHVLKLPWGTTITDNGITPIAKWFAAMPEVESTFQSGSLDHEVTIADGKMTDTVTGEKVTVNADAQLGALISAITNGKSYREVLDESAKRLQPEDIDIDDDVKRLKGYITKYRNAQTGNLPAKLLNYIYDGVTKIPDIQSHSQYTMFIQSGMMLKPGMNIAKYRQTEIPLVRFQTNTDIVNAKSVDFQMVTSSSYDEFLQAQYPVVQRFLESTNSDNAVVYFGSVKVADVQFYDPDTQTVIVASDNAAKFQSMEIGVDYQPEQETKVLRSPQSIKDHANKETTSTGALKEETFDHNGKTWTRRTFAGKDKTKYGTVTITYDENGAEVYKNPEGQYVTISDKGKHISTRTYTWKERKKSTNVPRKTQKGGRTGFEGTSLENFKTPGKRLNMPIALQDFVLDYDRHRKSDGAYHIDTALEKKISNGTLKSSDVLNYLRTTPFDKMDENTFAAINKSFFKNDKIKTVNDLETLVLRAPEFFTMKRILGKINPDLLTAIDASPEMMFDIAESVIKSNNKLEKMYKSISTAMKGLDIGEQIDIMKDILSKSNTDAAKSTLAALKNDPMANYDAALAEIQKDTNTNKAFANELARVGAKYVNVSEPYLRASLMRMYDGSLASAGDAATMVFYTSLAPQIVNTGDVSLKSGKSLNASRQTNRGAGREFGETVADKESSAAVTQLEEDAKEVLDSADPETLLDISLDVLRASEKSDDLAEIIAEIFNDAGTPASLDALKSVLKSPKTEVSALRNIILSNNPTDDQISRIKKLYTSLMTAEMNPQISAAEAVAVAYAVVSELPETPGRYSAKIGDYSRRIWRKLTDNQIKKLAKKYPGIFTTKRGVLAEGFRWKDGKLLDADTLKANVETIKTIYDEVKSGEFSSTEKALTRERKARQALTNAVKKLTDEAKRAKEKSSGQKEEHDYSFNAEVVKVRSDREMPQLFKDMLSTKLSDIGKTSTKYVRSDSAEHIVMKLDEFIDQNYEKILNMTDSDVHNLVDYIVNTDLIPTGGAGAKAYSTVYEAVSFILIEGYEKGDYPISVEEYQAVRDKYASVVEEGATALKIHQYLLKKHDTKTRIWKKFASQALHIDLDAKEFEAESEKIAEATRSRDPIKLNQAFNDLYAKVAETEIKKRDAYRAAKEAAKKAGKKFVPPTGDKLPTKDSFINRVWKVQRTMMLSGPGTITRNDLTNIAIGGLEITVNGQKKRILPGKLQLHNSVIRKAAETDNALTKLVKKTFKVSKSEVEYIPYTIKSVDKKTGATVSIESSSKQYNLAVIKPSEQATQFVRLAFGKSGLLDNMKDGLMKYDTRDTVTKTGDERFSDLMVASIKSRFNNEFGLETKAMKAVQKLIYKFMSDDPWVDSLFEETLAKVITADNLDFSKGISTEILNAAADSYVFAASMYMHKDNFVSKMEREGRTKLEERLGKKTADAAMFMYHQIFPFAGASYNWAIEGLKHTPIGLISSIINLNKIEYAIARAERNKQHGRRDIPPNFVKYTAQYDITSGVIGSVTFLAGILAAALGLVQIDDDDDELKIKIGDVYFDINKLYASQGFMVGASIVSAFTSTDTFWQASGRTLNTLFDEFSFYDLINSFRYSGSAGEWAIDKLLSIPSSFIPAFLKQLTTFSKVYNYKFSSDLEGRMGKFASSFIPAFANINYAVADPYTGEYKAKYVGGIAGTLLLNAVSTFGPIKVKANSVSDIEREAISLGINKSALTGGYTVNGEKIKISQSGIRMINQLYGQLNNDDLSALMNDNQYYTVENDQGKRVVRKYSQMNDTQKRAVIKRIMLNNSSIAKIKLLTEDHGYKYYASADQYTRLQRLGITKNVYRSTATKKGFIS